MPQAKVISLINMKGGVGKTTLAIGLAWELARKYRVLLVDIDPQFNATQWAVPTDDYLGWLQNKKKTVFDIFQPDDGESVGLGGSRSPKQRATATLKNAVITVNDDGHKMGIVPSILDLMRLDAAPRGTENRLRVFLGPAKDNYDYILIDCPPTASLFSYSAYLASDAYLVPIKPDPLSVLGLPLLERAMEDYEDRSGQELQRLGLVFTQVRQTDAMRKTMVEVRAAYPGEVFEHELKQTTGVAEAVEAGQSLQTFAKTKTAMREALSGICSEFIERVNDL
ncbi:ParA family protein [Dyella sp. S184]|uniref:ParA family protein n=1 Tax=Dyella sp. S184 TaxID=1641862 RepID=UPI00131AC730|nr:ParA family protein [Dyella sp. S184]